MHFGFYTLQSVHSMQMIKAFYLITFLFPWQFCSCIFDTGQCFSTPLSQYQTLRSDDLPLCGNGVLDAGEVCDDGNRLGGDGCNGWCTAFDRMTRACTLAGQSSECSMGVTLASSSSQSSFCSLSSVAVSPDGKYLVVADGGVLVRMDLFTDSVMQNLFVLPATVYSKFGKFCSVFVLKDRGQQDVILAHECENQKMYLFINGASQYEMKALLPLSPHPVASGAINKGFLDSENNRFVVAGLPLKKDGDRAMCAEIYGVDLTSFATTLLGSVDCVAFNVVESGRTFTSFSMDGMMPYRVQLEACPSQLNADQCYVVYMERNDMQLAKAYIPVDGGSDVEYVVSTDETLNVLGAPIVTRSEKSKITYTLVGNCFSATSNVLSKFKMPSPVFSLGNSCGLTQFGSMACATPLNNPFITDIVSYSTPLPSGLSANHKHHELLSIFMNGNASALLSGPNTSTANTNMFLGGLPLYRQVLDNAHRGNVPIDFVELPQTQDVIYITQTTIGMINSKGVMLMDIYNPGYCRPVHAILCPSGFFGSVGGICKSCNDASDTSLDSVSAQIQCTGLLIKSRSRRLLSASQSAPYTQVSMIVSSKVSKVDIDILMNYYLMAHGYNCSEASAMTGYQPYNMAADLQDAKLSAQPSGNRQCTQLIPCVIESAGQQLKKNLTLRSPEEYLVAWTLQQSSLVDALTGIGTRGGATSDFRDQALACGISREIVESLDNSNCKFKLNLDFHNEWLPCALKILNGTIGSIPSSRRLLQANEQGDMLAFAHAQSTFMSMTSVTYGVTSQMGLGSSNTNGVKDNSKGSPSANSDSQDSNTFVIIVVAGSIVGLMIALLVVIIVYMYFIRSQSPMPGRVPYQRSQFPLFAGDVNYIPLKAQ
jgi:cysteine-rich repeat protein